MQCGHGGGQWAWVAKRRRHGAEPISPPPATHGGLLCWLLRSMPCRAPGCVSGSQCKQKCRRRRRPPSTYSTAPPGLTTCTWFEVSGRLPIGLHVPSHCLRLLERSGGGERRMVNITACPVVGPGTCAGSSLPSPPSCPPKRVPHRSQPPPAHSCFQAPSKAGDHHSLPCAAVQAGNIAVPVLVPVPVPVPESGAPPTRRGRHAGSRRSPGCPQPGHAPSGTCRRGGGSLRYVQPAPTEA